jgi:hypothetical protein
MPEATKIGPLARLANHLRFVALQTAPPSAKMRGVKMHNASGERKR